MARGPEILWFVVALMTCVALAALVRPLLRRRADGPPRHSYDIAVYRDQLAELARDVERGVLQPDQAEGARLEIERRILAAESPRSTGRSAPKETRPARFTAALLGLLLPAGAVALYLQVGAPGVPSAAGTASLQPADAPSDDAAELVRRLTESLAKDPAQPKAWVLLARALRNEQRYADSAQAYAEAIKYGAPGAEVQAAYGEVLVVAADRHVSAEAVAAFQAALKADPREPRARYYLALAKAQAGQWNVALVQWLDLERDSPPHAAWRPRLAQSIEFAARQLGLDASKLPSRTATPGAAAQPLGQP